jgi:integrase
MKKTEKLNYQITKKYALTLINECDKQTDSRLMLSNRMFGLVLLIGLESGARITDILNLTWDNIKECGPNEYMLSYHIKKTKKDISIPISNDLVSRINNNKNHFRTQYGFNNNIFYNYGNGTKYTRVWASKRISKANLQGLLGDIIDVAGSHSLRRTAAINVFEKSNGDIRIASMLLGHKNLVTTSNYLLVNEKEMFDKLKTIVNS